MSNVAILCILHVFELRAGNLNRGIVKNKIVFITVRREIYSYSNVHIYLSIFPIRCNIDFMII